MKYLLTTALIATASIASAEYQPTTYAYEATMQALGGTNGGVLAHEFANCPARSGSEAELYAVINSQGQAQEDALNAIFESNPAAVGCMIEVLVRYDLLDPADFVQ